MVYHLLKNYNVIGFVLICGITIIGDTIVYTWFEKPTTSFRDRLIKKENAITV